MLKPTLSIIALLAMTGSAVAGGTNLYVSTQGSDTGNDCQTLATPCLTIVHAIDEAPLDAEILIAGGSYEGAADIDNPGVLELRGGFNETFSAQDSPEPTIVRSKGTRPLTFRYAAASGSILLERLTIARSSSALGFDPTTLSGGGVLVHAVGVSDVDLSLEQVTMEGNKAGTGGALALIGENGATTALSVASSRFTKNKAVACAGILVDAIDAPPAQVSIQTTLFEKNKASESGGAICLSVTDTTAVEPVQSLDRLTFIKNKASIGAGLFAVVIEGGNLNPEIVNSVFLLNKAIVGGGIATFAIPGTGDIAADINLTTFNNTLSLNKAKSVGGGFALLAVANLNDPPTTASTVTHNSTNDIVFGNKGFDGIVAAEPGTTATLNRQYGIFGQVVPDGAGASIVDGASVLSTDPNFVIAGKDIHLVSPSPAIDTGTCTGAPTVDFEGDTRPDGAGCDMGADEF